MQLQRNLNRFKEPRGFIKIIQFFVAIFAFSTTAGYYSEFKVESTLVNPPNATRTVLVKFSYPFDEAKVYSTILHGNTSKKDDTTVDLDSKFKSESQFFVFVGVISFLYCIVALVYYVALEDPAKYGPGGVGRTIISFATVDFFVTMVLALFWFAGSVAWAAGFPDLKDGTDAEEYIKSSGQCKPSIASSCRVLEKAGYAGLTISVLFGFLSCFLWCANVWFVYKETHWHREPGATTTAEQPSAEIPRQQVPEESIQ